MNIVAILCIRNEELFLDRCLRHLHEQGVRAYIVDNESTDRTVQIARAWQDRCVIGIETLPFSGTYKLADLLQRKEQLHVELGADWYIHQDPDEIRQAPRPYGTLAEGIAAADAQGYNAIDFIEFDFVPTDPNEHFEGTDFVQTMRWYYHFKVREHQHVKAWKNFGQRIDLASGGGHHVQFEGLKIAPQPFILRHYIVLSLDHAIRKYTMRPYDPKAVEGGWHRRRAGIQPHHFVIPARDQLKYLDEQENWDTSQPRSDHLLFGSYGAERSAKSPAEPPPSIAQPKPPSKLRRLLLRTPLLWRLGR